MMEEASELARLREENARLRGELARLPPGGGGALASQNAGSPPIPSKQHERGGQEGWVGGAGGQITPAEIERYSRQMLLPAIGVQGAPAAPPISPSPCRPSCARKPQAPTFKLFKS